MWVWTRISDGLRVSACASSMRFVDLFGIVAFVDVAGVPTVGFEALADIFGEAEAGSAGERDVILIVKKNQLA